MNILQELNSEQQQVVTATEGPILVLAGAGSGKTRALTYRVAYLIQEKNISPFNILAVTFTNKAAAEMASRVAALLNVANSNNQETRNKQIPNSKNQSSNLLNLGGNSVCLNGNQATQNLSANSYNLPDDRHGLKPSTRLPWMGTFHSICVKILRREAHHLGYDRSFTIYDAQDQQAVIKKILKERNLDPKKNTPSTISYFISGAKAELVDPIEYQKYAAGTFQKMVSEIYTDYQKHLKRADAMDFDDLIMNCVVLFRQNPEVLLKYQQQFKYILIDEYQDTNQAQYIWAKLLASLHKNICVVGDDYQSIYRWRGANFKNILDFEKDYTGAKVIKMEQNYRSTKAILGAAQGVIEKNTQRTDKKLWTKNQDGVPITVYEASNDLDEADFLVREINALKNAYGYDYRDFAILYRTNAQSRVIEESFIRFNLPYQIIGGVSFYQRREVKDIIAYLRLINNQNDLAALERIINVPARGIGPKTLEEYLQIKNKISNINNLEIQISEKISSFLEMIEEFREIAKQNDLVKLIEKIAIRTGYKDMLLDGTPEGEARWENIEELMNLSMSFMGQTDQKSETLNSKLETNSKPTEPNLKTDENRSKENIENQLSEFLERVSLYQDSEVLNKQREAITLMTLHSAKGLEYKTVFIVGTEEGIFPHSRSFSEVDELEEERRLCYVGITRARERLYLLYAQERMFHGSIVSAIPSRFIEEIPKEFVEVI